MSQNFFRFVFSLFALAAFGQTFGQNKRTAPKPAPGVTIERRDEDDTAQPKPTPTPKRTTTRKTSNSTAAEVKAAFDKLVDGIQKSSVDEVMSVYWNSPQLILFNNNGTVTRSWEQTRSNRTSSYPNAKNVSLKISDEKIKMLGSGAALVTCLWTQTQEYKGAPESSSGRMTLVFQKIGGEWKIVHAHTSPDAPDPSRLPASERRTATTTSDAPTTNNPDANRTRPARSNSATPKPRE